MKNRQRRSAKGIIFLIRRTETDIDSRSYRREADMEEWKTQDRESHEEEETDTGDKKTATEGWGKQQWKKERKCWLKLANK